MKWFKVSEVAKIFGLSTTAIYKHLKRFQTRLKEHISKDGGLTLVSEEGVNILRESMTIPTLSSREITPASAPDNRLDGIEKAVLAIADQMKVMVEENRRLSCQVEHLQNRITALLLPPAPASTRGAWQPEHRSNPADGMPWYQRLWVEWFEPERMRRYSEN